MLRLWKVVELAETKLGSMRARNNFKFPRQGSTSLLDDQRKRAPSGAAQLCIVLVYLAGLSLLGIQVLYLYQTQHLSVHASHKTNATFAIPGILLEAVESLQSTSALISLKEPAAGTTEDPLGDLFADGEVNAREFHLGEEAEIALQTTMSSERAEHGWRHHNDSLVRDDKPSMDEDVPVDTSEAAAVTPEVISHAGPKIGGANYNAEFDGVEMTLTKQITLPQRPLYQKYNIEANFWPVTKYLKKKGWAFGASVPMNKANLVFTRGKVPSGFGRGKQMLNSIGLSGCIGGSKKLQLECRQRLAKHYGCKYDMLGIQPSQYAVDNKQTCLDFFERARQPGSEEKLWLYKPSNSFHGAGIKLYKGPDKLWQKLDQCRRGAAAIVMEYVSKPATIKGGYKFDFRSYLLVASLKPQLVFYHDGFIRKADTVYSETDKRAKAHITNSVVQSTKDHFFSFSQLNNELKKELGFSDDFMDKAREYIKKVTVFVFNTARVQPQPLGKVNGRWHIFGLDWIIDKTGKIHLLEGNGYPLVSHYPGIGLTPKVWEDMVDLVLAIHTEPSKLSRKMTVKANYTFGDWSLVFNELEEIYNGQMGKAYNACLPLNPV